MSCGRCRHCRCGCGRGRGRCCGCSVVGVVTAVALVAIVLIIAVTVVVVVLVVMVSVMVMAVVAVKEKTMLYFNAPGQEKVYPMKELMKELFTPKNQDNKNTTPTLKELPVIMAEAWIGKWLIRTGSIGTCYLNRMESILGTVHLMN